MQIFPLMSAAFSVAPAACFSVRVSTSTKVCTAFEAMGALLLASLLPWQLESKASGEFKICL
jgi:hypothetical protein